MNLFIFRVETGTMLEFQLDMATESVAQLKLEIMKILQVPPEDQVLLVSGGISLDNGAKVISYSAGTDTNPIFLFSKQSIESPYPPSASPSPHAFAGVPPAKSARRDDASGVVEELHHALAADDSDDNATEGSFSYMEYRKRVLHSKRLPPTMETVTKRARLAHDFYEEASREARCCQSLVHDQHLQHQGWAAAIANLEDITVEFQKRINTVRQFFGEYLDQRDDYVEFLNIYKEALDKLAKIPIIPSLLLTDFEPAIQEEKDEGAHTTSSPPAASTLTLRRNKTLLEWIEARRDSKSETTMETLFETSVRGIEYYHAELFANLYAEVEKALDTASQNDMKEISGLSSRLYGLNTLVQSADGVVKEQEYSSQSFQKNHSRAGHLGDTSVLPDLCDSHRKQLSGMLHNHWRLCDIHKRCMRSKEELCNNLYMRLKWVIHVENLMRASTDRILAYYENVLRLRFNLSVLQQIHLAPEAYLDAVVEVVRRKKFSQAFLLWASELACYMLTIYNEEMTRRRDFKLKYDGHFLMGLFPGMNDLPPSFATQAPSLFDSSLPNISIDDIEELKKAIPELAENLVIPDLTAITNFFLAKSTVKQEDKAVTCVEDKLVQVVNEVGLSSNLDQNLLKPTENETCLLPHGIAQLKDLDKGCESETDTEEFEKVGQSPMELHFEKEPTSPRPGYNDVTTITEVCAKSAVAQLAPPPKKPPRTFHTKASLGELTPATRALSTSGGSHTESFTNIKNTSLESIDELSSLKNVGDSCYNSHHQHLQQQQQHGFVRSKSLSPHTPYAAAHSPRAGDGDGSPMQGHQPSDFVSEEFYIDESLPSSLSIDAACAQAHDHAVGEIAKQLSNANDVVALLQDNLQSSRSEQDKLKDLLVNMATLCRTIFINLRQQMDEIKTKVQTENSALELHCKSLGSSWDNLTSEFDLKEKEIHKLTESHQQEICVFRTRLKSNTDELKCLREENSCLDSSLNKLVDENKQLMSNLSAIDTDYQARIAELEVKVDDIQAEKDRVVRETVDRMMREHKTEMDNLRKKFRFMTDRSPSECQDKSMMLSDITGSPELKRKELYTDAEKQKLLDEIRQSEAERVERILYERNKEYEFELNRMRDESRRMLEDKDQLIQVLRERENYLSLECLKQKNLLQQLTQSELETSTSDLRQRIDVLHRENRELERQLSAERLQRMESSEMSTSTSSCTGAKRSKYKEPLTISQTALVNVARVNMNTCSRGDVVLVIWKALYKHFIVVQESDALHFVHSDCIRDLELHTEDARVSYFTAQVLEKEYCQTKKSENRYNVPKGTKFYRVKIRPLNMPEETRALAQRMSQSQSAPKSTPPVPMEQSIGDSACQSLPSSPTKEDN